MLDACGIIIGLGRSLDLCRMLLALRWTWLHESIAALMNSNDYVVMNMNERDKNSSGIARCYAYTVVEVRCI